MNPPNYNFDQITDPFIERLAREHVRLDQLAKANPQMLAYRVTGQSREHPHPPNAYQIKYFVRSIVGIKEDKMPVYGDEHLLQILLPGNYPDQMAECKMLTDTWHPNIDSDGPFKGAICSNHAGFGSLFFLHELVVRIGEFLQYKRYLAKNEAPYPEDLKVAAWVMDFAEPNGIIDRHHNINTDSRHWKDLHEAEPDDDEIIITPID